MVSSKCPSSGLPHNGCIALGTEDRIRVPMPAARTQTSSGRTSGDEFEGSVMGACTRQTSLRVYPLLTRGGRAFWFYAAGWANGWEAASSQVQRATGSHLQSDWPASTFCPRETCVRYGASPPVPADQRPPGRSQRRLSGPKAPALPSAALPPLLPHQDHLP
jgi:hypothetical protein